MAKAGSTPLRDWACPSYDATNGRPMSSLNQAGGGGNHTSNVSAQVPSISGRDKSGSADTGRNARRGSSLP